MASERSERAEFTSVFQRLRSMLERNKGGLTITEDTPVRFCLAGTPGPASLRMRSGKRKPQRIPVAWVEIGKSYVSYHLMGIYANPKAQQSLSSGLKSRMQGKSCFNFTQCDDTLFAELEQVTTRVNAAFKAAGFVAEP
jgi:hypothetical protein